MPSTSPITWHPRGLCGKFADVEGAALHAQDELALSGSVRDYKDGPPPHKLPRVWLRRE
jgi:hypothetical protein